ncbi:MAG: methionyl-tRNA formyltransferase [Proteobacteria bacterium]|nr:methionyl-tRNA formyltransferase [Pseudomonadota bacterium]NIS68105.1 methionyl-tRNA formyltransferase [Pseudomonadota bacterium]
MKGSLPIVFMGTSGFAVPILQSLFDNYQVIAVVTQPDKPRGRGRVLSISEVKERALALNIPIHQPEKVRDTAFIIEVRKRKPQLIVVAAYGQILPRDLLEVPKMGCINVHASLLPKYRGAAPINWAIAEGESETGVTTIIMDEGMDTGPILLRRAIPIGPKDTAHSLGEKLGKVGAEVIVDTVGGLERGKIRPMPQEAREATYAPPLKKEDGRIDWRQPAIVLHRRMRAMSPWPGTFTRLGGKILKVFWAEVDETSHSQPPGCVLDVGSHGIRVATGEGQLVLKEVQLEGKKRLPVREFLLGHPIDAGAILE